jgi:hypothetical protein
MFVVDLMVSVLVIIYVVGFLAAQCEKGSIGTQKYLADSATACSNLCKTLFEGIAKILESIVDTCIGAAVAVMNALFPYYSASLAFLASVQGCVGVFFLFYLVALTQNNMDAAESIEIVAAKAFLVLKDVDLVLVYSFFYIVGAMVLKHG